MSFVDSLLSFSSLRNFKENFTPQEKLRRIDRYHGMNWLVRYGIASQAMETLMSGAFLIALALQLGASNLMIGILVAIPQITALMQVPGVWLVERWHNRKAIVVLAGMISRPGVLLIAVAPFIPNPSWAMGFLLTGLMIRYLFSSLLNSPWMSLARDLVPMHMLGRYFAQRFLWVMLTSAVITLIAAGIIDLWKEFFVEKYIYGVMALVAFFFGSVSIYCMRYVPEPRMTENDENALPFRESILQPFKDKDFRRLMSFLFYWNFATNLALPFFNVYMLQTLQLGLTTVMALTILNQLVQMVTLGLWGRLSDKFSNKMVMAFCCPLLLFSIFAWTFIDDIPIDMRITMLSCLFIAMGIATSGITLASNNINMKLAPEGKATSYICSTLVSNALATGIAPIIGGLLADFFASRTLTFSMTWTSPVREKAFNALTVTHWDFFFLLAVLLGIFALKQLHYVKEHGRISERPIYAEVLSEAVRSFAPLASVDGLRALMILPWRYYKKRRRKRRRSSKADPLNSYTGV